MTLSAVENDRISSYEHEIPGVSPDTWNRIGEGVRREATPLVVRGAVAGSAAVNAWTPTALVERIGEQSVVVAVSLPTDRAPYLDVHDAHTATMSFAELVERLRAGESCYLNQATIAQFGDLAGDLDIRPLLAAPVYGVNLWVGGRTRSGLHFDAAENFLVQLFGQKRAVLVPPGFGRYLRVISDSPSKSRLSPMEIEASGGVLAKVPRWRSSLDPGDALYIPPGWWHYLVSEETSISVNIWHGKHLGGSDVLAAYMQAGPAVWARTVRDFIWCGVLGRPYRQRLFCPPPLGVDLFQQLRRPRRH